MSKSELNPRTTHYGFFGPPGALFIILILPIITYALYFGCSEETGGCPPTITPDRVIHAVSSLEWWKGLWDTEATSIYLVWYAFCVVAWAILPGDQIEGVTLRNGEKKKYKINAFSTFLLASGIAIGIILQNGPEAFTFFYDKWVGFVTASFLMAFIQALYAYVMSFRQGKLLALGGNTGNFLYDFFIGRELNPTIGSFDIKSFNEVRPGLILWTLLDLSMVCEQAVRRGGFGNVTDSMWLVLLFQGGYVADCLYNEPAIFTTMDIITDGFGFMLSVPMAWVPFTYSLQARYLAFRPLELGPFLTIAIFMVNAIGYYIFRVANSEKNDFRNGRNPKNLKYFTTASGSKLLTSGWWGRSRHPNYFGDLLMALAWSLPTGFDTPITYFYGSFFLILLIHRQIRDDDNCKRKYNKKTDLVSDTGEDWEEYKKMVPYRIIPYVY
ncbi:ERG4/ERG24 ergosterol biosynthesis protein [Desarmillaria tabescens]|uniref:Delta(14)-sterol reductase n=1 Tax=Armillaria tabescens TaxID=1929756 RepID=A0AA39TUE6_ARMTA|nr:ERG4/ERG24 ergosterol biosynthesis protein [Desarmillaria tabescens]KAK0466753.1 ERG4/ERG24 ergosterol biosynthesis protein [Desarmillaria tabescens]